MFFADMLMLTFLLEPPALAPTRRSLLIMFPALLPSPQPPLQSLLWPANENPPIHKYLLARWKLEKNL